MREASKKEVAYFIHSKGRFLMYNILRVHWERGRREAKTDVTMLALSRKWFV